MEPEKQNKEFKKDQKELKEDDGKEQNVPKMVKLAEDIIISNQKPEAITVGACIPSCVGPIFEWCPVPENLPHAPTIAFFGKRRTGKSTTIKNMCFHLFQHVPFGLVMSNTSFTGDWADIIPAKFVVQGLRQDVLDWLVKRQKRLITKYGGDEKHPAVQAFIILDDGKVLFYLSLFLPIWG